MPPEPPAPQASKTMPTHFNTIRSTILEATSGSRPATHASTGFRKATNSATRHARRPSIGVRKFTAEANLRPRTSRLDPACRIAPSWRLRRAARRGSRISRPGYGGSLDENVTQPVHQIFRGQS
ncbi:hypothetical protein BDY21DRAFT_425011 [Lineolata rhizophorae]|uniref:Uncharacterized protein n=1 Tax=Lineolata rhizophorae TaxID=578093 RepID=A0A6A6NLP7_9PEZI|nr:hypothetical protein BDY21DRAFT_425011 [Lineolata rhizophorae]